MNNQKNSIYNLEKLLNSYGLPYELTGKNYPNCITSMSILGVNIDIVSVWDNEDFRELESFLTCCIEDEGMTFKELKEILKVYDLSNTDITNTYVKDSYQNSHAGLVELLQNVLKGSMYAQDKFESVLDKRATHEFKSTESAFLYKGYYVTPCILRSVIEYAWNDCTKENQRKYLEKYYNGQKQNIVTIASDCLSDMFNKNDIERLTMIDNLREFKGVGV